MTDLSTQTKDDAPKNQSDRSHICIKERIAYGIGSGTEILMANLILKLAFPVYNLGLGVSASLIGIVMMVTKIFDAASDPLMGYISDGSRLKWGRRKPFILIGGLLTGVLCTLMWRAPEGLTSNGYFWYFMIIALFYYTFYTVFYVPYNALGYEMTDNYDERTRLMSYKWGIGATVGLVILPLVLPLCYQFDPQNCAVGARVIGPLVGVLMMLFTIPPGIVPRERKVSHTEIPFMKALVSTLQSKSMLLLCGIIVFCLIGIIVVTSWLQFLNMAYVYAMNEKLSANMVFKCDIIYGIINIIFMFVASAAATRLDKKVVLICGLFLMCGGILLSYFYITPAIPHLQLLWTVLLAPGMSAIWVLTNSCIADVCDEDELRTGLRREGFYGAIFSFTMKLGTALGLGVAGITLDVIGFDKTQAMQTENTILKMRLLFAVLPAVFFILAGAMAFFYPITRKRHQQIQLLLAEKNKMAAGPA